MLSNSSSFFVRKNDTKPSSMSQIQHNKHRHCRAVLMMLAYLKYHNLSWTFSREPSPVCSMFLRLNTCVIMKPSSALHTYICSDYHQLFQLTRTKNIWMNVKKHHHSTSWSAKKKFVDKCHQIIYITWKNNNLLYFFSSVLLISCFFLPTFHSWYNSRKRRGSCLKIDRDA